MLPGAAALLRDGIQSTLHPGNRAIAGRYIGGNSDTEGTDILFDPQTSGGLLGAVPSPSVDAVMTELKQTGTSHAAVIGRVSAGTAGRISLERHDPEMTRKPYGTNGQ